MGWRLDISLWSRTSEKVALTWQREGVWKKLESRVLRFEKAQGRRLLETALLKREEGLSKQSVGMMRWNPTSAYPAVAVHSRKGQANPWELETAARRKHETALLKPAWRSPESAPGKLQQNQASDILLPCAPKPWS